MTSIPGQTVEDLSPMSKEWLAETILIAWKANRELANENQELKETLHSVGTHL